MPTARTLSATARTGALSAVLAAIAAGTTAAWTMARDTDMHGSATVATLALAVAFFAAEQTLITFEFRRESHSMTFAGVPLALGIMFLSVPALVLARLAGSVVAMLLQRTSREKLLYNASAFCFEAAVVATLCRLVVPDVRGAWILLLVGCIAAVDHLMTLLVLLVIRLHGMRMQRAEVVQVMVQSLVLSAVATTFAVTLRVLFMHGVTGYVLAAVLVGAAVLAYRMYAGTMRRHHSMAMVHEFVTANVGTATAAVGVESVAAQSLGRIRSVLRASEAELAMLDDSVEQPPGQPLVWTVFRLDDDDRLTSERAAADASDWVRMRAVHHGLATLAVRGRDAAIDSWLDSAAGARESLDDAVVVGLKAGESSLGVLTVSGRMTDVAVFTDEDVTLLQTLAGHLATSLQNARLLDTLSFDATHDALTGLANRAYLAQRIAALEEGTCAAVLLLDLDKFKEVNDVLGHETGDRLLAVVAKRMQRCLPKTATIARLGGDEFAVLLTDLDEQSRTRAVAAAQLIVETIGRTVHFAEASISPEVSVGIALAADVARQDLLRCADTAMYAAKASPERVRLYDAALDAGRAERLALLADLRAALEHNPAEFAVYFQPKIDLATGATAGAEALVRWHHPTLGLVPPDRFIALAETTGRIAQLTEHVLVAALTECAAWRSAGHDISVAVNLSPRLLADADVVRMVHTALTQTGVPATALVLEVTESVMLNDAETAIAILSELAAHGVSISLDDFGTGYSSLAYLQRLPVDEVKIDKAFVAALSPDNTSAATLLRSITALGHNLGLRMVAEGIETAAQMTAVRNLGCQLGQGYYFARPQAAAPFAAWLAAAQAGGISTLRLLPSTA